MSPLEVPLSRRVWIPASAGRTAHGAGAPLVEAGQASTMAVLGAIVPPRKDAFQALAAQPLTQAEMACRTRP